MQSLYRSIQEALYFETDFKDGVDLNAQRHGTHKTKKTAFAAFPIGGDKGSRTPDLLNAIETLYQLSYIPMN